MTDIIDFEDKRHRKLGKKSETEVEGFDEQLGVSPDSDEDTLENNNVNLDSEPTLKTLGKKGTQAEQLIRLAHESATFFHTPSGEAFGCMQIDNHQEIRSLKSKPFKIWLQRLLFEDIGKMPHYQAQQDALTQLEGHAQFKGTRNEVFIRLASFNNSIYVDMANKNWEQIEITQEGWRKIAGNESPVKFNRPPGMLSIAYPDRKGSVNVLGEFLNLESEAAFQLMVSWLIGTIKPDGPFPILLQQGEQGSAKSTTARLLKSVIDPSSVPLRTLPHSERDLIIAAKNGWILNFDNLSGLQDRLSDSLCRLATGSGFATRMLHTDDSESLFSASRPIIMNGISDIATRNDLAERFLIIHLPAIKPDKRMTEKELKVKWEGAVDGIRTALFDGVSAALRNIDNVHLNILPRMADFAKWVTAAENALPWENGAFINEYEKNSEDLVDIALDADPVATAVLDLVKQLKPNEEWNGTPTELLDALKKFVPESLHRRKIWPQRANVLSNKLRRAQTFLRRKGIEIDRRKSGAREITIRKIFDEAVQTAQTDEESKNENSDVEKEKMSNNPFSYTTPKHLPLFSDHTQKLDKDGVDDKDDNLNDKSKKDDDSNSSDKLRTSSRAFTTRLR